jgi:BirA family transcriptional regulator, biotin operon repressor / biotin---[acetyl-CoA-carboxylase] ligase
MNLQKYSYEHFPEISSTNQYSIDKIGELPNKHIVIADRQLAGRGRLDRTWVSDDAENLYMSIILKPDESIDFRSVLPNITQYTSVVLSEIFNEYLGEVELEAKIKWPNDVLVDGLKVAGILAESVIQGTQLQGYVLGIGINLNMTKAQLATIDKPAGSLNVFLDQKIDREKFLKRFLDLFFENYEKFLRKGFDFIKKTYTIRNDFLGKHISVKTYNSVIDGQVISICADGSLTLRVKNGEEVNINMGELL